jgi:hypothetical protein
MPNKKRYFKNDDRAITKSDINTKPSQILTNPKSHLKSNVSIVVVCKVIMTANNNSE